MSKDWGAVIRNCSIEDVRKAIEGARQEVKEENKVKCIKCDKDDTKLMDYKILHMNLLEVYACKGCGGKIEVVYVDHDANLDNVRSYSYRKGAWTV